MPGDTTFLIDEFLEALVAQLDKTQDALAFKAVNRPLTYAIKDFNLQLQVFVDLDADGNVRLRSAGPNEAGASTMTMAFTTITRPMIEENTISLSATRAPSLAEAGFDPGERRRLERLGVTNTAQLRRLGSTTGSSVVARLTEIPVDRLRAALQLGQPRVTTVHPVTQPPPQPAPPPVHAPGPEIGLQPISPLHGSPPGVVSPPIEGGVHWPHIHLASDTSHVQLSGTGLAGDDGPPEIRLNGQPVAASEADWDRVLVPVPRDFTSGSLEVTLGDGSTSRYQLTRQPVTDGQAAGWQPGSSR